MLLSVRVRAAGAAGGDGRGDSAGEPEPTIATTGGTLAGGQTLYYAVSALDSSGRGERIVLHRAGDDSGGDEHEFGDADGVEFFVGDGGRSMCIAG